MLLLCSDNSKTPTFPPGKPKPFQCPEQPTWVHWGFIKKKKSCARWLEMFAAYSFTVLEDGSSRFVHDSYEGSRRNVFLVFLAPGDSKCSWDCGSITIVTSCFLWSILSHMLLRNCLRWSNYKEVLWFSHYLKLEYISVSDLFLSLWKIKERTDL